MREATIFFLRLRLPALLLLSAGISSLAQAAPPARAGTHSHRARVPAPPLVWHVETLDGSEISSSRGDVPINPASVVKVATTLWALDTLGPEHRFDTTFALSSSAEAEHGVIRGDLIVEGTGDPDFQPENAFLVAARLNQLGIRQVRGVLRVNDGFWIGWEGGSGRTLTDPTARAQQMAQRLRAAFDPKRWTAATRAAWHEFSLRYSLPPARPPAVVVLGGAGALDAPPAGRTALLTHRSKTLVQTLRRFDCFSNNDIERLGKALGTPSEMAAHLSEVLELAPGTVQLETISGLGTNRMSPRIVVQLVRALKKTCERLGLSVESVLPVAGCDPGTLTHSFARLGTGPTAMSIVAKTGTLTSTDGGTAVLAGIAGTGRGDLLFCVAAPGAAGRLHLARRAEAEWLESLIAAADGPRPRRCAGPLGTPEGGASVFTADERAALDRKER